MKNGKYTSKDLNIPDIKYAWYKDDQWHREDGPAVEFESGSKLWYFNGKRHRIDGPAVEWFDGTKEWYLNGKYHRLDGPAIEDVYGSKFWYYHGEYINCQSQEEFERIIKLLAFK